MTTSINRRTFLKAGVAAGAMGGLVSAGLWGAGKYRSGGGFESDPIRRLRSPTSSDFYLEDDPTTHVHPFLWKSQQEWEASLPAPSQDIDVAVVGGGMAGLISAYLLRDRQPYLFEQSTWFGGNSRGERWDDLFYSTGAAYLGLVDGGSDIDQFLTEIGVRPDLRREGGDDLEMGSDGGFVHGFWSGNSDPTAATHPEVKALFTKTKVLFDEIYNKRFPDVPFKEDGGMTRELFERWDRMSFTEWCRKELGTLHPHIEEYFTGYCWSSFCGHPTELSAYQTLNFLASDVHGVNAFPGGNSWLSQRLVDKLRAVLPKERMQTRTLTVSVRLSPDGKWVWITNRTDDGQLKTYAARACVFAAPKFVARHVIQGIPQPQLDAIARLKYRGYLVANVLVDQKAESHGCEMYWLRRQPKVLPHNLGEMLNFTDMIFAAWAGHDQTSHTGLTLYRALPFDSGRAEVLDPKSYASVQAGFVAGAEEVCRGIGIDPDKIRGIRVSRWGHAMPLAAPGWMADGWVPRASAPVGGRIFFANQDVYANPCFELALRSSKEAEPLVRKALA